MPLKHLPTWVLFANENLRAKVIPQQEVYKQHYTQMPKTNFDE